MPTRIALKQPAAAPKGAAKRKIPGSATSSSSLPPDSEHAAPAAPTADPPMPAVTNRRRQLPSFRSSILRELNVRTEEDSPDETLLATDDIRASPRLLGYLFSMIAGAVMLVSVIEFYRQRITLPDLLQQAAADGSDIGDFDKYFYFFTGAVYKYKLWGAIYMGSAGVALSFMSVLFHFDTVAAPKLWLSLFRDGSLAERNWILFLIVFWAAAVHVCTSALSVGESQANVYFTTWIAFGATAMNFGVWRESAGLPSLAIKMTSGKRETTYNWIWISFFSFIFAGSATGMYYNRDEITLRFQGQPVDLASKDWRIILSVVWAEVALCFVAILLNESFHKSWRLPCVVHRSTGNYRCVFGWRQLEGFVILLDTGCKFWVILEYAAVDGVIPGLSNAYFGVWGSFFNGVFALGTWLRENKNIEYIVRDGGDDDDDGDRENQQGNGQEATMAT